MNNNETTANQNDAHMTDEELERLTAPDGDADEGEGEDELEEMSDSAPDEDADDEDLDDEEDSDEDADDEEEEDSTETIEAPEEPKGDSSKGGGMKAEPAAPKKGIVKKDSTPAWVDFIAALESHARALGLGTKDQVGYVQFFNAATGHKLYVAKQGKGVNRIDTTLPVLGQPGTVPLEKVNGKIECHIVAELGTVKDYLGVLASDQYGKLRASRRPAAASK